MNQPENKLLENYFHIRIKGESSQLQLEGLAEDVVEYLELDSR